MGNRAKSLFKPVLFNFTFYRRTKFDNTFLQQIVFKKILLAQIFEILSPVRIPPTPNSYTKKG
jgi:hypothetical protein